MFALAADEDAGERCGRDADVAAGGANDSGEHEGSLARSAARLTHDDRLMIR